jgi:ABC-2 type transport system ATP-binding protein
MTNPPAALEVRDLAFGYGPRAVVRSVSMSLQAGDCYGFLGHNGAGKTTVLRLCLSLLQPSSGTISIHGFDVQRDPRGARSMVGALIERPGFHPHATALQNLALLARLQGMDRARARVDAWRVLDLLSLHDDALRPVASFSLGMRQRLGIAQALLGAPRLLLLDEPINGLDPEGIAAVRGLLRRLAREDHIGVLLSSHQLQELEGLCTRIGVLREGAIVLEGSLEELQQGVPRRMVVQGPDLSLFAGRLAQLSLPSERDGDRLLFDLGTMRAGQVARELAAVGEISSFAPEIVTLESIYLRATRGAPVSATAVATTVAAAPASRSPSAAPLSSGRPRCRALAHELRALCLRKSTKWLVVAPLVVATVSAFAYQGRVQAALALVANKERFSADSGSGHLLAVHALQTAIPVLLLVVVWLGSQTIAADLQRDTLRNSLVRSVTRLDILLGKLLAVSVFAAVGWVALATTAIALGHSLFGLADLEEVTRNGDRQVLARVDDVAPVFWAAVVNSMLPLLAAAALALLASAVAKRSARALLLALVCVLGPEFVQPFVKGHEGWLLTSHLPTPLRDDSSLRYAAAIARGAADADWAYESLSVWAPVSLTALAVAAAALLFHRLRVP